jgi:ACS family glucarate transporter-like MFS transporter
MPSVMPSVVNNAQPSRVRWRILGLLFVISVVTYVDRVNISVAGKALMPALGLSAVEMGTVFSAFVLGYALFQIPGGWLGDRWGARLVLAGAVFWWSLFTVLTAVVAQPLISSGFGMLGGALGALLAVRFLIGVGEAAALPNFNRTVSNWMAPSERGLGMGVSIGGIGFGSAITPPLVAWLMTRYGWPVAFYVTGAIGLVVAAAWYLVARDHPQEHPGVNPGELAHIGQSTQPSPVAAETGSTAAPFSALLKRSSVWFLTLSYTMLGYIAYIYLSWFFLYLVNVRHFSVLQGSFWAACPFIAMATGCPLGGWLSDRLTARHGRRIGRAGVGGTGLFLTAGLIYGGALAAEPDRAILLLSLGAGVLYATVGAYWASTIDLSHRHSGALSGLMNMGANLGGVVSPTLTPMIGEAWGWPAALTVAALVAVLGGLLWIGVTFDERSTG